MSVRRRAGLSALLLLAAAAASAQPATLPACRAHVDGQWRGLGYGPTESCLKATEQAIPAYNAQGFKFGLSGTQMLALDAHYYYRSQDAGHSWTALGLKTALKAVVDAAPLQASGTVAPPPAVADAVVAAASATAAELRPCNLFGNGSWQTLGELTLQACGDALDKTPNLYDEAGYKYAYWGALSLAADALNLLRSDNGADWIPLRPR